MQLRVTATSRWSSKLDWKLDEGYTRVLSTFHNLTRRAQSAQCSPTRRAFWMQVFAPIPTTLRLRPCRAALVIIRLDLTLVNRTLRFKGCDNIPTTAPRFYFMLGSTQDPVLLKSRILAATA